MKLLERNKTNTLYIFDEPSKGLFFTDLKYLKNIFEYLLKQGDSLLVISHNLDIIRKADWIIDLGGEEGGELIYQGNMSDFLQNKKSLTASALLE